VAFRRLLKSIRKAALSVGQRMNWSALAVGLATYELGALLPAVAAPYVPADDSLVLEAGLPSVDPRMREMRVLSAKMRDTPTI
jgi:hypothetical protein